MEMSIPPTFPVHDSLFPDVEMPTVKPQIELKFIHHHNKNELGTPKLLFRRLPAASNQSETYSLALSVISVPL